MKGRKPKPVALKLLEGDTTHGTGVQNPYAPTAPDGEVECPKWLTGDAKKEWNRLVGSLIAMNVLKPADLQTFAAYCQSYANWKEAETQIKKHGSIQLTADGLMRKSPYVEISNKSLDQMHKFAAELGLTPSSRSRIIADAGTDINTDPNDEMEQLLRVVK